MINGGKWDHMCSSKTSMMGHVLKAGLGESKKGLARKFERKTKISLFAKPI